MQEYNCNGSIDSSYGAGAYNTCTSTVGAPTTGFLHSPVTGGGFEIIIPLVALVVLVTIASIVRHLRKKRV